jgi:Tfp pilus assembly protein PilN
VQYLERLDSRQKSLLAKLELLERQRQDIPRKLEAWGELTRLVPHPAWLQNLLFNDSQVMAVGQADSASNILQALSQSVHFQQPEFSTAISKNPEGREVFQIRMRLRELVMAPPPAVSSAPAGSAAPGAPASGVAPGAPAGSAGPIPAGAPPAAPAKKGGG